MKKFFIVVLVFLLFILITIVVIRTYSSYYDTKLEKTVLKTHIKEVRKSWGNPDYEFLCKDCSGNYVLKYKKDIVNWNTYIFQFDSKDSLLVKKGIDD